MRIARVETRRYEIPLAPPFAAAWDPVPRDRLLETITIVHSDDGLCGYASGAWSGVRDAQASSCGTGFTPVIRLRVGHGRD